MGDVLKKLNRGDEIRIEESPLSSKDYIHISDVVELIEKIALSGRHTVYNVASGRNTKHSEIAEMIQKTLDIETIFKKNARKRVFQK